MPTIQRTPYIDIAKGLLILVVIFHHIMFAANDLKVVGDFNWNLHLLPLYASWFMPAFFIITGYCSNFKKDFRLFMAGNMRTLLWPAVTIFLLSSAYDIILFPEIASINEVLSTIPIRGFNWFLMAMFLSKTLYWIINRYISTNLIKGTIVVLISVSAILFNDFDFLNGNWFHYRHALYLTLFLYTGQVAKDKNLLQSKYLKYSSIFFVVVVLTCMKLSGVTPGIAGLWINFNACQIPLHVFLAVTGTSMVLYVSILICKCKILESIGRDSLIYYLFHIEVIRTVLPSICKYLGTPLGAFSVLTIDIVTLCIATLICAGLAYIFNHTKLIKLIKL